MSVCNKWNFIFPADLTLSWVPECLRNTDEQTML